MTAPALPAVGAARPEPGIERFRWPFICLAGIVLLIFFRDVLPAWVVTPPKTWTENLPLPYLDFGEGFLPTLSLEGSNVADWFNAIVHFLRTHVIFGLYTVKDITRAVGRLMVWPLDFAEAVLIVGFPYHSITVHGSPLKKSRMGSSA